MAKLDAAGQGEAGTMSGDGGLMSTPTRAFQQQGSRIQASSDFGEGKEDSHEWQSQVCNARLDAVEALL